MLTFVVVVVLELRPDVIIDVLFVIAVGAEPGFEPRLPGCEMKEYFVGRTLQTAAKWYIFNIFLSEN